MSYVADLPIGVRTRDDLDILLRTVQLHAPVTLPSGVVCRNCSWPYPCPTRVACDHLLADHTESAGS
jgi:hypothetical protein